MDQSKRSAAECHLTFLGWERPILWSAADLLVARTADPRAVDLSSLLVAVPGERAGRRLTELLLERAEARGKPLRPPRVTTIGSLPEELYTSALPPPGPVVEGQAWRRALGRVSRDDLALLSPGFADTDGDALRASFAAMLADLNRRVGAAGMGFGDVARICRRDLPFSDEGRWRVLARIQDRYLGILTRAGWADREQARRAALDEGAVGGSRELWLVGIPDLPPITRAFVDRARASVPVHVLVGAPSALASHFDSLGSVVPDAWEGETLGLPEAAIRVVSGPGDQADEVLEGLVRVARGRSPDQVTIGAPDRTVVPYLVERLGEEGIHARYAGGRDIERTGPFRLLSRVADYLEERRFDAFAELIRHPDLERRLSPLLGDVEDTPPAVVDRYRAIHLPARLEEGWLPMGGEAHGRQPGPAFRLLRDGLLDVLKPLKGSRRLSEWSAPIRRFLEECYGSGALDRGTERDREILEAMSGIGGALEEMDALAVDLDDFVPAHRALRVVIDGLAGTSIPPPAADQAIDVLGWLELALDDAPVLLITGANEPYLPESVSSDPFLPHTLQQALGLLDNRGRWARDLLHARTIVATRKEALFIAGRQDGEGNPLWVSRLLLAERPGIAARRIRAFLGPGAAHGRARNLARGAGAPLTLPPEPILSAPLPPERVRVTAFRELLADPYRYALERVLGLEGSNDTAREMGPAPFGTLAHVVLQGYGRGGTAGLTEPREIRDALDQLLEQEARSRFGTRPLPTVALQVEQLRGRLRAFAKWQAEWMQQGWRLRYVERSFMGAEACLLVDGRPTVLSGKVDRIDENEETGVWCVLDYKTGERALGPDAVHRRGSGGARRWVDLQLPLYRHLAPALLDDGGEPILPPGAIRTGALRVGYVCLSRDPRNTGERWAEWSDAELDDAIETAREVVRALRANRFEHDPESSTIRVGDPLAPILGGGILRMEDVEGAEDA